MAKPYMFIVSITPKGVYQEQHSLDKDLTVDDIEALHFLVKMTQDGAADIDTIAQHLRKSRLSAMDQMKLLDESGYVRMRFMHDMDW